MIAHDQYRVAFDLSQKGFQWWFPACGLVFVAIGGVVLWLRGTLNWPLPRSRKTAVYLVIGFGALWSGVMFLSTFKEYVALHTAYRRSQFSVVEGRATNFRPMPYEGAKTAVFMSDWR